MSRAYRYTFRMPWHLKLHNHATRFGVSLFPDKLSDVRDQ